MTLVRFYYERYEDGGVFAFFPKEYWVGDCPTSYAHNEGHGPCCPEYVKHCKPVRQRAKWLPMFNHLKDVVGYNDLVRIPEPKRAMNNLKIA